MFSCSDLGIAICVVLQRRDDTLLLAALFDGDPEKLVCKVRAHGIGVTQVDGVVFQALDNLLRAPNLPSKPCLSPASHCRSCKASRKKAVST